MIDDTQFAKLMQPLGPFEPGPVVAVAVSGGSDSMALALLAQAWAAKQGGKLLALTVDHGLREGSRAEALQVGRWMKRLGISHRILTWTGDKPQSGRMETARLARYALLEEACAKHGVLHLLTAHQLEDQAETLLLRLARGSGAEGLAAMAPVLSLRHVRLLRPLLGATREGLRAFLKSRGQDWIEDPSNDNPAYERARLRQHAPLLAGLGLSAEALAASAGKLYRLRRHLEDETAGLLARHVSLHPLGFAWAECRILEEPSETLVRAFARLLASLGGSAYLPAPDRVEALLAAMRSENWRGGTLAGCRLARRLGRLLIVREAAACEGPVSLGSGGEGVWDGRFRYSGAGRGLTLAALGAKESERLAQSHPQLKMAGIPSLAWASLPAILDRRGVFAVPGLGYKRSSRCSEPLTELTFAPRRAVLGSTLLLSWGTA